METLLWILIILVAIAALPVILRIIIVIWWLSKLAWYKFDDWRYYRRRRNKR